MDSMCLLRHCGLFDKTARTIQQRWGGWAFDDNTDNDCDVALLPWHILLQLCNGTWYPRFRVAHGPLARYVNLWVVHAPGMPGTFLPPPPVRNPDMHHGTCMTHVPWCMSGSLTSSFLWSWRRGKRSRHSRRMRNTQFYVSGKRPIDVETKTGIHECSFIFCELWITIKINMYELEIWRVTLAAFVGTGEQVDYQYVKTR